MRHIDPLTPFLYTGVHCTPVVLCVQFSGVSRAQIPKTMLLSVTLREMAHARELARFARGFGQRGAVGAQTWLRVVGGLGHASQCLHAHLSHENCQIRGQIGLAIRFSSRASPSFSRRAARAASAGALGCHVARLHD